jgi:uncharacterized protein YbaR (Trm112 family)
MAAIGLYPDLLALLCCPETRQQLKPAQPALIEMLNRQIASGELRNRAGQPVTERLDGGLVREDGRRLYAIRQDIPVMLVDESIALE